MKKRVEGRRIEIYKRKRGKGKKRCEKKIKVERRARFEKKDRRRGKGKGAKEVTKLNTIHATSGITWERALMICRAAT